MAIFLIKDRDATHVDAAKDLCCYKRGDVVQVFDDDTPCVIPPAPPFVIVKIAGPTKTQAEKYMQSVVNEDGHMIRRRLYHLAWADLPASVRKALVDDRYYETTWTAVKAYVKNKLTGESE